MRRTSRRPYRRGSDRGLRRGFHWKKRPDHEDDQSKFANPGPYGEDSKEDRRGQDPSVPSFDLSAISIERKNLPIYQGREEFLSSITKNQTVIVTGETGCGKSTQVPQYILEQFPNSKIVVTQPRRMSTISLAKRVAEERKSPLGEDVGYLIQSDRRVSEDTKIFFMTTGFFIARLTAEVDEIPWTHIILDEVHERSIEMDFLLVLMKHILSTKKDLKLILMSATVDSEIYGNYFSAKSVENVRELMPPKDLLERNWVNGMRSAGPGVQQTTCPYREHTDDAADMVGAGGKPYEVATHYLDAIYTLMQKFEPFSNNFPQISDLDLLFRGSGDDKLEEVDERLLQLAVYIVYWQHCVRKDEPVDVRYSFLIFLPGLHEINVIQDLLQTICLDVYEEFEICVLHSAMPEEHHSRVFDECEPNKRRIILSTNIAESSVTLPDVRFVIDLGFSKEISYNSLTRSQVLELKWASKATMNQRKGRAGRVARGICYRLMPQPYFDTMLYEYSRPEIQRCPLDKLILRLKQLTNIGTPTDVLYRAIEPPDIAEIERTEIYLRDLGALDRNNDLTWLGRRYADMPCDLRVTRLAIFGYIFGMAKEGLLLAAIISQERPPVPSPSVLSARNIGMSSKYYSARIVYDGSNNSDPITMLNAYLEWKKFVGGFVCQAIRRSFLYGRSERPWITPKERGYCADNFVDPHIMREIYQTYLEYRKRINQIDPLSQHLPNGLKQSVKGNIIKTHGAATGAEALKLVIAAAFKGKYLVADYLLFEGTKRSKMIQKLNGSDNSMLISCVPEGVEPDDIVDLLEKSRDPNISVRIDNGYVYVDFSTAFKNCLRMGLWLGQYSQRYRNGDSVVLKKVFRRGDEVISRQQHSNINCLFKLPREIRLEGINHVLEEIPGEEGVVECIEALCLTKPEYPYQLKFKDFLTSHEVRIADDSINFVSFETNEALVTQRAWVCAEYIDRANIPIARMVTAFKACPLTAHILTMLFARHIELCTDDLSMYYDCFKTDTSDFKYFDYRLSNFDIKNINEIRKFISTSVSSNEDFIRAPATGITLIPVIMNTIFSDRIDIVRDAQHWRDVINSGHEPSRVKKVVNEDGHEDYLRQIEILEINDDETAFEKKKFQYREKKAAFLHDMNEKLKYVELRKTELHCKMCNNTLGYYDKLEVNDARRGMFYLNSTYGNVFSTDKIDEMSTFINSYVEEYGGLSESWAECSNNHVFGWYESGKILINSHSPIVVVFPTLVTMDWTRELWEDNMRVLISKSKLLEAERARSKPSLICTLCDVSLPNEQEFIKHFTRLQAHKDNLARFIADFT